MCESENVKIAFIDKEICKEIELKPEALIDFELIQVTGSPDRLKFTRCLEEENLSKYQDILKAPSLPDLKVECEDKCIFGE